MMEIIAGGWQTSKIGSLKILTQGIKKKVGNMKLCHILLPYPNKQYHMKIFYLKSIFFIFFLCNTGYSKVEMVGWVGVPTSGTK